MIEFYRVTRLDSDSGEPIDRHDPNWQPGSTFLEHEDIKQIEHWIFHQRKNFPQAEFRILQIAEREIELDI